MLQVLEDQPKNAVDLLETSLLVKKSTFDPKESSPLVPIPVRGGWGWEEASLLHEAPVVWCSTACNAWTR